MELDGKIWIGTADKGVTSGLQTKIEISASEMGLFSRRSEMETEFSAFGARTSIISIGRENWVRKVEDECKVDGCVVGLGRSYLERCKLG